MKKARWKYHEVNVCGSEGVSDSNEELRVNE